MDTKKLILLNIHDEILKDFITNLTKKYHIKPQTLMPHITLRGPFKYKNKNGPSYHVIKRLKDYVDELNNNNNKILLNGVGMFENNGKYIVYLNVEKTESLKQLFMKKDYTIKKHGFNPHVTLLITDDKTKAMKLKNDLDKQDINIECNKIDWNFHKLGNKEKNIFNIPA